jgi:hypothetical protein
MIRKILLFLLLCLIVIQFIHPKKNWAEGPQPNYIGNTYAVPANVHSILQKACNDCHSNSTRYPWYARLQPVDWWMHKHIVEGKKELNFDEYTSRSLRYQYGKMKETIKMVKDEVMPLKSYTWIHKDAILTMEEKTALAGWADGIMKTLESKYPMDSLVRKQVK